MPPLAVVTLFVALVLTALSGAYAGWLIARVQNADHEVLERRVAELERELALRRQLTAPLHPPLHPPLAAPAQPQPAR